MKTTKHQMVQLSRTCIYEPDKSEIKKVSEFVGLTKKEKLLLDLLVKNKKPKPSDSNRYAHLKSS